MLFDHIRDAVLVVEAASEAIVLWNPAAERIFGRTFEEVAGQRLELLFPEEDDIWARAERGPVELEGRTRAGEVVLIEGTRLDTHEPAGDFCMLIMRDVTERWRMKSRLSEAEARWRLMVEYAPEIITILDADSTITFINRVVSELDAERVIGTSSLRYLVEEDREKARTVHERVYRTGRPEVMLVRGAGPSGRISWYRVAVGRIDSDREPASLMVVASDVTGLVEADEGLRHQSMLLAEAQRLARMGSWEWSVPDDRVVWSDEMYRIYGRAPATFGGHLDDFLSQVHPEDAPRLKKQLQLAVRSGMDFELDQRIVRPDGEVRILHTIGHPLIDDGEVVCLIGTCQDITDARHAEEVLERQAVELEQARALAVLKSQFVNALSHELRTPLTAIRGYLEFLEEGLGGPLTEQQQRFVEEIMRGTGRLEHLIDDLLDYARLEAGTFQLRTEPTDLSTRIEEVASSFAPRARAAKLELGLALPEVPIVVDADPRRLGQVLSNLIDNAIKFTPPGGCVKVLACRDGADWRIEVRDTGPGISAADREKLFKRFSQLEQGKKQGGTGLGLSIAKAIVEAHRGQIGVLSKRGAGSTFWFTLPASSTER